MDDVILLENPRRRRRKRRADGRFTKSTRRRTTRRRRRRNPTTTVAAKPRRRRRNMSAAAPRRRAANPRRRTRRRRRSSSGGGYGGRVMNMNRAMRILQDGAGLAAAEAIGDIGARAIFKFTPLAPMLDRMGLNTPEQQRAVFQIGVGILAGPMLRRFLPRVVSKNFEVANVASGLIALTYGWRSQAIAAMGLSGYGDGGAGLQDYVTVPRPAIGPAPQLADWETVSGAAGYGGDPWSMAG